jgi:HK97 family phage major capsid protein
MFPALKTEQDRLDALRKELHGVFTEAGPELDMSKVKSLDGDSAAKVAWIRAKNAEIDDVKSTVDGLLEVDRAAQHSATYEPGTKTGDAPETKDGATKSIGALFTGSEAFKGFRGGQGPTAHLDIELKTLFETGAGWAPETTRSGLVTFKPTRPAPDVIEFLPQIPTIQSAYKYMEETTLTNNAAETAEGGSYAESALALTEKSVTVQKISTFLPVTDEQLEDEAGAQAYVDNRLTFMLRQRLDGQALVGNGTAPNLRGTENVVGIQSQALGADPIPDAIYKCMTLVRSDGFAEPTVVFIQPGKWQTVRLMRTADGIYIWGSPSEAGPERIWGVPVKQTMACTSTKAVLGDYAAHSLLVVRRGIDVQVSNSHSTYFVEGKQAVRADVRVAVVHLRPKAFGVVTGL